MKKKEQFEYRLRWDDIVYQPGELKVVAYNGLCLVIVAAEKGAKGTISLKGESQGLKSAVCRIDIK
jgi:beta-galactosidase